MSTPSLPLLTRLKSRAMSLPHKEASLSHQGFPGQHSPSREHLEKVLLSFVDGYNLAVVESDPKALVRRLEDSMAPEYVGFAFEGTGLYFAVMDLMIPGSKRLDRFTHAEGGSHDYIAMVGAGFAISRVPFGLSRIETYQKRLDEFTAFLLADGYGFHDGFFNWRDWADGRKPSPECLTHQNRLLYDSGVARAMWWVYGADPASIAAAISRFDEERRAEMWAGVGVALCYASAGPGIPNPCAELLEAAGPYRYDVLTGLPFAAHMRWKGGNPAPWTTRACEELIGMSVEEASGMVVTALNAFLDSWKGPKGDRWAHGYLAVREHLRQSLVARLEMKSHSAAAY
ncbi:MAG TPA: DUF1702 family protein [Bryobacteraceae bacterium]|jgi:hypothetical protein|nr:DUF1702 family protein [Bryobacteraceae bacterium]